MTDSEYLRCDVFLFSTLSDRASLQVQENGLAQAAVQAAAQGRGGLLQDDAALQHPRVKITKQTITRKPLNEYKTQVVVTSSSPTRHRATNMFLDAYKRNWLETEGYSFEDKMIDDLSVSPSSSMDPKKAFMSMLLMHFFFLHQKALEEEEEEEEETETKPDPLHQLILHFSRTALTEKT